MKNMFKTIRFTLLCVLFFASVLFGWSGHEGLTYLVVKSTPFDFNKIVEIRPYTYNETRVYNEKYYYKDDFAGTRKFFDPLANELTPDPEPVNGKLPVWQILTIYAQFPDFGMDEELKLHPLQALIGNSQGVRHMRYKLGIIEAFEGDKSFLYFLNMSKQAFSKGDEYWGYRFFSYALHYIEDLFQPYHETPGSFWEVVRSLFDKETKNVLNNAHYTYDNYLAYMIYHSPKRDTYRKIIEETPPAKISKSPEALINEVMMYGYTKFLSDHKKVKTAFKDILPERVPELEDFEKLEAEGKLDTLEKETIEIVKKMTAVLKWLILNYLPN